MYQWKCINEFSEKPQCQEPVIRDLRFSKDKHGIPQLSCVASGTPAPDIILGHNETKQEQQFQGWKEAIKHLLLNRMSNLEAKMSLAKLKILSNFTEVNC